MKTMAELIITVPQIGRLAWIGVSSERRSVIREVTEAIAEVSTGLTDDYHAKRGNSKRQVTLIQHEHLAVIAALCRRSNVTPDLLRRNLVISGINLLALRNHRFRIGETLFEGTGLCAPCSRMEEALGPGGYNAVRGHGGITANVIEGGTIRVGDPVRFVTTSA